MLRGSGVSGWVSLIDVSPLRTRVRSVFGSYGLALGLAMVIGVIALRPISFPSLFFVAKTLLVLLAVVLAGLEFTRAASITMIGGTDLFSEPWSTWLFLMTSLGALAWSVLDQRHRCRVCHSKLGLVTHVGCPGRILLDWAGMELVCLHGHGMLHVPELASCWHESERWTVLDESWAALISREGG